MGTTVLAATFIVCLIGIIISQLGVMNVYGKYDNLMYTICLILLGLTVVGGIAGFSLAVAGL